MRFTSTLELGGKTATGLEVPTEVVTGLAAGGRPKVTVTLRGFTYRSSIAMMGGRYLIPVSAEVRGHTGLAAGDEVEVEVAVDDAPREVTVPEDLAVALAAEPAAAAAFAALSYSNQSRHVLSVEGAKAADTRARRVAKVVETLRPA
ncbi:YdeI/OmpD-associated family protein [uncultured Friedmanniella sp.]|uniref:YdeI/OmpD-associated family protein n=1 Tax=uncultured Friedmanniella sp. TaxID=335381 RepID=UPI0035CACF09